MDVPQDRVRIGVSGYRDPAETRLLPALELPSRHQRDAWQPRD